MLLNMGLGYIAERFRSMALSTQVSKFLGHCGQIK